MNLFGLFSGKSPSESSARPMNVEQLEKASSKARDMAAKGAFDEADRSLESIIAGNPGALTPCMVQAAIHIDSIAGTRDINQTLNSLSDPKRAAILVERWRNGQWKAVKAAGRAFAINKDKARNLLIASLTCLAKAQESLQDWEACDATFAALLEAGATTNMARMGAINAAVKLANHLKSASERGELGGDTERRANAILARAKAIEGIEDSLLQSVVLQRFKAAKCLAPNSPELLIGECEHSVKFWQTNVPRLTDHTRDISEAAKADDVEKIHQAKQELKELLLQAFQIAPGHPRLLACEDAYRQLFASFR